MPGRLAVTDWTAFGALVASIIAIGGFAINVVRTRRRDLIGELADLADRRAQRLARLEERVAGLEERVAKQDHALQRRDERIHTLSVENTRLRRILDDAGLGPLGKPPPTT